MIDTIDESKIAEINSDFDKLISEEDKKENKSSEYIDQLKTTKTMFNRHCEDRKKTKLSEQMLSYYKKNISAAFDAMISTENLRKRKEEK